MAEKVMTVVLRFDENAELPSQLTEAMHKGIQVGGCNVTAVSNEDEIARVEQFENAQMGM
ncbi:hypothetical protein [Alteromonas antoniana]|uniref:hypothetical protein n=1 Tax=Alteromonas antoniana TaxID=2803813 RepID=UPI001C484D8B|nr:hypothetical protein [Alteromonas antoniana]